MKWFENNILKILKVCFVILFSLSMGSCANTPNKKLEYAAMQGQTEAVKLLISQGADVNVKNWSGNTPLYWAVDSGNLETVKVLISNGADVNVDTGFGSTPLEKAAKECYPEIASVLISNGADVNAEDINGHIPLWHAANKWAECEKTNKPWISNIEMQSKLLFRSLADRDCERHQKTFRILQQYSPELKFQFYF